MLSYQLKEFQLHYLENWQQGDRPIAKMRNLLVSPINMRNSIIEFINNEILLAKNAQPETISAFINLTENCEFARYAPSSSVAIQHDFDKAVVANSFDAHRLSHLAKKYNLQNELEEKLFSAYFTEGKNTADYETLLKIALEIGMDREEVSEVLKGNTFTNEVHQDVEQAQQIGVRGVPFFVLNQKYAISGAQESDTFLQALHKAYDETKLVDLADNDSAVCGPEGCEI